MDEDIVTAASEQLPDPTPVPDPLAPDPAETQPPVNVVSVDELADLLSQSLQEEIPEEALPGEGEVIVEDPVPGLINDAIDVLLGIRSGMKNIESIERTVNHPMLTTSFRDYTVTEGLLLLVLLCFFIKACATMVRRAFSWLL